MGKRIDLASRTFGRLLVVKYAYTKNKKAYWETKCSCGTLKIIGATSLLAGNTQSCGCLQREKASEANKLFDSNPALRKLIDTYRNGAKNREIEYQLTLEEADAIFQKNCFYCNEKPSKISKEDKGKYTYVYNGIDRVNNNEGYIISNVVPCCTNCNLAKHQMSIEEFKNWICKVYNFLIKENGND